ncbi:MAG TPA: metallophosphoesterase family protein [Vicinamibacterales bacterium]|nr:metallophosphoesterase family protein [Vicinamibacterales bacterium]
MRYLILSDIHANIDAFEAVLEDAAGKWDRVLVLGDLVGYGAEPNAVMDRVKELAPDAVIRGNHDKAACGIDDGSQFNHVARVAAIWTGTQLTADNLEYIRALPMGPVQIDALTEICHGAPFDEDHYIFDGSDAVLALRSAEQPLCLFGHTHLPALFKLVEDVFDGMPLDPDQDVVIPLQRGARYLVNVGSIGQPRDGDPRAGYGVLDDEAREVRTFRVPYPVEKAQQRIIAAGLPASLANRLALGR